MTDVSQGPGWWIASDGKWYPPHLHPSVAELPASSSYVPSELHLAHAAADVQPTGAPSWTSPSPYALYPPGYGPPPGMPPIGGVSHQDPSVRVDEVLHLALAPWWKRFVALLIDSMALGVVAFVFLAIVGAVARNSNSSTTNNQPLSPGQAIVAFFVLFLLASIPIALYYGIMNGSKRGQTLGKMAMGIAVRDARTGGPIGFWRGVGRYAITVVFYAVLVIPYVIDNLSPLWDSRRQAWHDHVVHSVVVERNP
jgi:uncharacterized RDD family membrane protein YckC